MEKNDEERVAQALENHEERIKGLEERASLRESSTTSSELEARLKEESGRAEQLGEQVVTLEQENASLKGKADLYDRLEGMLKDPAGFVQFAAHFGYTGLLPAETLEKAAVAEGEKPKSVLGPTDDPDYEFYPHFGSEGISILREA